MVLPASSSPDPTLQSYRFLGRPLLSPWSLPELPSWKGEIEGGERVEIRRGPLPAFSGGVTVGELVGCWSDTGALRLFWPRAGGAEIRSAHEVVIDPLPGVDPRLVRLLVLGPVLEALARWRGLLVLHGAALALPVAGGEEGIAMLGASGAGKSTLAAALALRGARLLSDDAVVMDPERRLLLPLFSRMKLEPSALTMLGLEAEEEIAPGAGKYAPTGAFGSDPAEVSLDRVVILEPMGAPEGEITGSDGVMLLMAHASRAPLMSPDWQRQHFGGCARLQGGIRMERLARREGVWGMVERLVGDG